MARREVPQNAYSSILYSPLHILHVSIGLAKIHQKIHQASCKTLPGFRKQCERFGVSIGQKHIAESHSEDHVGP